MHKFGAVRHRHGSSRVPLFSSRTFERGPRAPPPPDGDLVLLSLLLRQGGEARGGAWPPTSTGRGVRLTGGMGLRLRGLQHYIIIMQSLHHNHVIITAYLYNLIHGVSRTDAPSVDLLSELTPPPWGSLSPAPPPEESPSPAPPPGESPSPAPPLSSWYRFCG